MAININPGSALRHASVFTSSGTWTAPTGTTLAFVSIHGATGGGGGYAFRYGGTSGAGGTGVVVGAWIQVVPGAQHIVTIGAGGAAGTTSGVNRYRTGNNGAAGGSTVFDSSLTVTGTTGGQAGGGSGSGGAGSGQTTLSALSPSASALIKTGTISSQNTGASAGGTGASAGSRYGATTEATVGASGIVHIYI